MNRALGLVKLPALGWTPYCKKETNLSVSSSPAWLIHADQAARQRWARFILDSNMYVFAVTGLSASTSFRICGRHAKASPVYWHLFKAFSRTQTSSPQPIQMQPIFTRLTGKSTIAELEDVPKDPWNEASWSFFFVFTNAAAPYMTTVLSCRRLHQCIWSSIFALGAFRFLIIFVQVCYISERSCLKLCNVLYHVSNAFRVHVS